VDSQADTNVSEKHNVSIFRDYPYNLFHKWNACGVLKNCDLLPGNKAGKLNTLLPLAVSPPFKCKNANENKTSAVNEKTTS
jgi:hypothetical protein